MAAAVIPLVLSVLPTVLPLIVKLIDKAFGNDTGPVKLTTATEVAKIVMAQLQGVVGPSVGLPTAAEIPAMIQLVVDQLNKEGVLKGVDTVISVPAVSPGATSTTESVLAMDGVAKMLEGAMMVLRSVRK